MELNLCRFPNDVFHTFESFGQDNGVNELDVVTQVYAVLCHG
jgi:hypothetical protein